MKQEKQPKLCTVKAASVIIGVQYRQLLDAVNTGTVPHYQIGKSQRLINVEEAIALMRNDGGCHES